MTKLKLAANAASSADKYEELATLVCRKISTKADEERSEGGFATYVGQASITAFINLNTDENVRDYIPESGQKKRRSEVHEAIAQSLREKSDIFNALNGGIVIVAESIDMLEDQKRVRLKNPSIINGSQTCGEIRNYLASLAEGQTIATAKFEIVVTKDKDLAAEISIARNFQNKVQAISIFGKKGYFNDMAEHFVDYSGQNRALRKSETDRDSDEQQFVPTEKLIQVLTTLIPESLWSATGRKGEPWNKTFAYSSAQGPLKMFGQNYEKAKELDPKALELNQFYLDMCSTAWKLYEAWTMHAGFKGTGLKNGVDRDEKGNITKVYDGLVFPILAAFAAFVEKKDGVWQIMLPQGWDDNFIIQQAKRVLMSNGSNPQTMGKTASSYSSLMGITSMAKAMS